MTNLTVIPFEICISLMHSKKECELWQSQLYSAITPIMRTNIKYNAIRLPVIELNICSIKLSKINANIYISSFSKIRGQHSIIVRREVPHRI